jgi:hypothetical protein
MPIPPPKKKLPPPKRHDYPRHEPRQNGLRFQPNMLFESVDEINKWIKIAYPGQDVKLISSWKVERYACQIEKP